MAKDRDCFSCKLVSSVGIGGSALYTMFKSVKASNRLGKVYWGAFSIGKKMS